MLSYIPEDKLLIANDAFGQHIASIERFADQVHQCEVLHQSTKYYANILMLLSPLVQKVLAKVGELKLDICFTGDWVEFPAF